MIRKIIINSSGIHFKKIRFEGVKLSEMFITKEAVLTWVRSEKPHHIHLNESRKVVKMTVNEFLNSDLFLNDETKQENLIRFTLKQMSDE